MLTTFVLDRLYLGAYVHPPNADTLFPAPPESPRKRAQRAAAGHAPSPSSNGKPPCYFTIDDTLLYNAFHHDFGPLHIGHLYRFAIQFHDILGAKENKDRPVVFWSAADPRSKFGTSYGVWSKQPRLTYSQQVAQMPLVCSPATWC